MKDNYWSLKLEDRRLKLKEQKALSKITEDE
jgi:hypothetical protein